MSLIPPSQRRTTVRLLAALLAATAGLTLSACASRSKPGPAAQAVATPLPSAEAPPAFAGPEPGAVVRSGSQADLAASAGDRVYFALDSHELSDEAQATLDRQAAWLARHAAAVIVEGHADERGTREYNLALGARRAEAVRQHLISRGVDASRLRTVSFGKERPLDPRSNEEGWAINRNAHTAVGG
jgi:peptidoglycan-associated lipoprotein